MRAGRTTHWPHNTPQWTISDIQQGMSNIEVHIAPLSPGTARSVVGMVALVGVVAAGAMNWSGQGVRAYRW